jgi:hypothetical protein
MSKLRWAKFFWADWQSDTALNLCSIPARGLWMALLCVASQGQPYGTVTIKDRVPTNDELFSLIAPRGTRRRDFNLWLAELERNGVTQRDHRGAIVSPRMSQEGVTSLARIDAAHESWKQAPNRRHPRDVHKQNADTASGLHKQDESFAHHRVQTPESRVPPVAPQRWARGRAAENGGGKKPSLNAGVDLLREELNDAATTSDGGAPVVPFPGRAVSRPH